MKIFLINSPSPRQPVARDMAGGLGFDGGEAIILPPLDLAYMAATLESKGDQVEILDADVERLTVGGIYQKLHVDHPDVTVITVSLPTIHGDCQFAEGIRHQCNSKIILKTGISHPPLLRQMLQESSADICVFGESDLSIDQIIKGEDQRGTARISGEQLLVGERHFITDLNLLPLPARHLLPNHKYRYVLLGEPVTTIQTSRGCPFPCSHYCAYPLAQGRVWRARSADHVLAEIEDVVTKHHIRRILFRDAIFTLDRDRTLHICDLIIKGGYPIQWWCETRVDRLDPDLMRRMQESGCLGISIGVETGDEDVRTQQAKTGLTSARLSRINDAAKALGLKLHFLLMIGLPAETRQSLYSTYQLICDLKPSSFGICTVTPYPGTELHELAISKGWIQTEDWSKYGGHYPVMHTDHLTRTELMRAQKMFYWKASLLNKGKLGNLVSKWLDRRFRRWASA